MELVVNYWLKAAVANAVAASVVVRLRIVVLICIWVIVWTAFADEHWFPLENAWLGSVGYTKARNSTCT